MPSWKGKTRGGLLGYQIFIFILKKLGLSVAYIVLRFVCAYFVIFAPSATRDIYKYFRKIKNYGRIKSAISVYKSFYVFGQTLVDKIAIASGMRRKFTYTYDGIEHLRELKDTGGVLLSAHLGNWEIAGLLLDEIDLKTNILIFEAEHEKIKAYLDEVMKDKNVGIIAMKKDFSHIFKINAALKKKEIICIHGDRFLEGSRTEIKGFMDKQARFPLGPFSIVHKLKTPYSFAYAVRGKGRVYHLSATPIAVEEHSPQALLDKYVKHLEGKLSANPTQWFNYYDFWN